MTRVLDISRRVLLALILLAGAVVIADAAVTYAEANPANPAVGFLHDAAERATPNPAIGVVEGQEYWQTALFALAVYAILTLLVMMLFRGLRAAARVLEPYETGAGSRSR